MRKFPLLMSRNPEEFIIEANNKYSRDIKTVRVKEYYLKKELSIDLESNTKIHNIIDIPDSLKDVMLNMDISSSLQE